MTVKNENREWGSFNTYSKVNNKLMAAEFLFTLKLDFRFLFIFQITRRVEVPGWGSIRTNE